MATYLILNLSFMTVFIVILVIMRGWPSGWFSRNWLIAFIILIILTVLFDSVLVSQGIVAYDLQKILGIYAGSAPIEDLAYAILAAIIIPILWYKRKG